MLKVRVYMSSNAQMPVKEGIIVFKFIRPGGKQHENISIIHLCKGMAMSKKPSLKKHYSYYFFFYKSPLLRCRNLLPFQCFFFFQYAFQFQFYISLDRLNNIFNYTVGSMKSVFMIFSFSFYTLSFHIRRKKWHISSFPCFVWIQTQKLSKPFRVICVC